MNTLYRGKSCLKTYGASTETSNRDQQRIQGHDASQYFTKYVKFSIQLELLALRVSKEVYFLFVTLAHLPNASNVNTRKSTRVIYLETFYSDVIRRKRNDFPTPYL